MKDAMTNDLEKPKKPSQKLENIFELFLWNSRLIVLIAVIFAMIGSVTLFIIGGLEILHTIQTAFSSEDGLRNYNQIMIGIIGSIDLFLIGIVLMIFSFGVYELFISKIDIARLNKDMKLLDIDSLDELKNKILKVVVMVLVVTFFKISLTTHFTTPLELLYFAISIIAVSAGVYLIRKYE